MTSLDDSNIVPYSYRRGLEMGGVKAIRDRTFKGIMEREGIDEEGAMIMVLDLGLKDYVVELYRRGGCDHPRSCGYTRT